MAKRVLVVTDDQHLVRVVTLALAAADVHVMSASSRGELAVGIARNAPFDLVVSEIATPWITGLQVLYASMSDEARSVFVVRDHATSLAHARSMNVHLVPMEPRAIALLVSKLL